MPTTKNGITVHDDIKDTCLGCHSDMPYHTAAETFGGVTVQIHLRYCPDCHANTISELAAQRAAKESMAKFDAAISDLRGQLRGEVSK